MVEMNGMIYALGNNNLQDSHVMIYDRASGKWTRGARMLTPRQTPAVAAVNGLIYCIGGSGLPGDSNANEFGNSSVNEVYDPGTDTWVKLANMPSFRRHVQASVVDDVIYVTAGNTGNSASANSPLCQAYDPSTDTWTKKADMLSKQGWSESNVIGKKIYVTGGWEGTNLSIYDTVTDTWTISKALGTGGSWGVATTVHKGQIYIFGGNWNFSIGNTFKIYDAKTDTMVKNYDPSGLYMKDDEEKKGIPYITSQANAVTADDKIYLVGGIGSSNSANRIYVYDPLAAPPINRLSAANSKKRDISPNIGPKEKLIATWGKLKEDIE